MEVHVQTPSAWYSQCLHSHIDNMLFHFQCISINVDSKCMITHCTHVKTLQWHQFGLLFSDLGNGPTCFYNYYVHSQLQVLEWLFIACSLNRKYGHRKPLAGVQYPIHFLKRVHKFYKSFIQETQPCTATALKNCDLGTKLCMYTIYKASQFVVNGTVQNLRTIRIFIHVLTVIRDFFSKPFELKN